MNRKMFRPAAGRQDHRFGKLKSQPWDSSTFFVWKCTHEKYPQLMGTESAAYMPTVFGEWRTSGKPFLKNNGWVKCKTVHRPADWKKCPTSRRERPVDWTKPQCNRTNCPVDRKEEKLAEWSRELSGQKMHPPK